MRAHAHCQAGHAGGDSGVGGIRTAIKFPRCANFDPLKYTQGLAEAISKKGGAIFETTRVKNGEGSKVTTVAGQTVNAPVVVFATHSPTHRNLSVHSRQSAEKLYCVALKLPEVGRSPFLTPTRLNPHTNLYCIVLSPRRQGPTPQPIKI